MSRSRRVGGPTGAALAIGAALLLTSAAGTAQSRAWRNVEHTPPETGLPSRAAVVDNEQGYSIRVQMANSSRVLAIFKLPPGLTSLDASGCPTFKVDDEQPDTLHLPAGRCRSDALEATVEVAEIADGGLESPIMLQLLNGTSLDVIHRLRGAGYRSTRFSLKGSKNALKAALPQGTTIAGD